MLVDQPDGKLFVAISRDGRRVSAGGEDNRLAAWDAETGRLLWMEHAHHAFINSVALSPDGARLASGGPARSVEDQGVDRVSGRLEGAIIQLRDAQSGRLMATISPASIPEKLAFDETGSKLIAIHPGGDPSIWDAATGWSLQALGRANVPSAAFSDQVHQRHDIDRGARHTIALERSIAALEWWDIPAKEERAIGFDPEGWPPTCVALDSTGTIAAALDLRQSLTLSTITEGKIVGRRRPAGTGERLDHPVALAFAPGDRRLVSGDVGGVVRIWNLDRDKPPRVVAGPKGHVRAFAFLADGRTVRAVSGGWLVPRDGPMTFEPLWVWEFDLGK
jgi:WD40 repeat protein